MAKKTLKIADKPTLDEVNEKISGLAQFRGVFVKDVTLPADSVSLPSVEKNVSTLPYNFYYGSAVVYNNEIHILGSSYNDGTYINYTKHYKWDGSSWTSVSTLPYAFASGSAVVLNGEIHILGGFANQTAHYKWDGSSWTEVSTLPYNFKQGSAVVLNNEIHILGSSDSSCRNYHYKWNGTSWTEVSTLPYEFQQGSAVVYDNEIHILGGGDSAREHYKWNGTSWTEVSTLPYAFQQGSAVVYNSNIHILGSAGNNTSNYKWNGSYWLSISKINTCYDSSAVVYNNEIHILGSNSSSYQQQHTRIPTSFYKGYEGPYLFKNQKIYNKYKLVPLENCIENEDSLLVLDNGVVKFGIETNDTEIMLTIV